ncbi:MAG: hypothetical protein L0387_41375 [Acidobacteria bacterium]|nr:hypothetical protein [Acidobacteriota bacterium]
MKRTTLERIAPLLEVLRAHPALQEIRLGEFLVEDRDFLHFHEEPEGIFADVRLTKGRVHLPVSSPSEQLEFLERIDQTLSTLESRVRDRQRRAQPAPKHQPGKG